ncbi:MAG: ATP-dependent metallopeptidase FtsH/Yme1/Tma family protein [Alphaproteobacteria bacterium]|nr:MAG: ATP-dependent metallopeptidase FtsH/Yme1/Tma family protein [Alphaproteobacteria bacterium]
MKKLKRFRKKSAIFWLTLFLGTILFFQIFSGELERPAQELNYSELVQKIKTEDIRQVSIKGKYTTALDKKGVYYKAFIPYPEKLLEKLDNKNIEVKLLPVDADFTSKLPIFMPFITLLMILGLLYILGRSLSVTGSRAMGLGKSRAKIQSEKSINARFKDVAGIDEAKSELQTVVEFLKNPKKFEKLGGKIPKGVLLYGPPGNGKTLLARAIAGEAGVRFYTISGSDFVEMVVGVGAARVRDLFDQAKKHTPCIIFIDELDAIGRKRNMGMVSGGHEEREQTLNQLLVEMDGFESNKGIIIIAATNRVDVLDSALLRPGRFDRHVPVTPPDIFGRTKILEVHTRNMPLATDVKLEVIARGTPGFSGADLESLANEAALYAAQKNQKTITMKDFEYAKDKIIMGAEKQGRALSIEDRETVAYHEAGHAVLAYFTKGAHPIHKVTIIPRGQALGMVVQLPEKDEVLISKQKALANIIVAMGGRIAEEMFFGADRVTSGASNDIMQATNIAKKMVTEWALSDDQETAVFRNYIEDSDHHYGPQNAFSESVMERNDKRIENILKDSYKKAVSTIKKYKKELENLAKALLEFETLDLDEVTLLFEKGVFPTKESHKPS